MTKLTRRTALAAAAAAPLAPLAGQAGQEEDPAVIAYHDWREAYGRFLAALQEYDEDDPAVQAADAADHAAAVRFAETVPTTLAGLACQVAFMPYAFGEFDSDGDAWAEPGNYRFGNWLADDREAALCRSMQAGVRRLMEGAS